MFIRITSRPDGPGYSNSWPVGPEAMAYAMAGAFAVAVPASVEYRFPMDVDRFLCTILLTNIALGISFRRPCEFAEIHPRERNEQRLPAQRAIRSNSPAHRAGFDPRQLLKA